MIKKFAAGAQICESCDWRDRRKKNTALHMAVSRLGPDCFHLWTFCPVLLEGWKLKT